MTGLKLRRRPPGRKGPLPPGLALLGWPACVGGAASLVLLAVWMEGRDAEPSAPVLSSSLETAPRVPRLRLSWEFQAAGPISGGAIAGEDGGFFVGSHDGHLYALGAAGDLRWARHQGAAVASTPARDAAGNVYVGSDGGVLRSYRSDGFERFRFKADGPIDRRVVYDPRRGRVLFAAGASLYSLSTAGDVLFRFEARQKIYATPAVTREGVVVVGSQDDHVYAIGPDGTLEWSFRCRGDVDSGAWLTAAGHLVFGSDDQHVYSLAADGTLRWKVDVAAGVRAAVVGAGPSGLGRSGSQRERVWVATLGPIPALLELAVDDGARLRGFRLGRSDSAAVGVLARPTVTPAGTVFVGAHNDTLYKLGANGRHARFEVHGDIEGPALIRAPDGVVVGSRDGSLRLFTF